MKAGTKLLQQLFVASQAGRRVEMKQVLKHELSHVQLSLAKVNGKCTQVSLDLYSVKGNYISGSRNPHRMNGHV